MAMNSIKVAGIVWYKLQDYEAALAVMQDAKLLPPTYSEWRMKAEQAEKKMRRDGWATTRVYLDPAEFTDWCAGRRLNIDAKARQIFANEGALQASKDLS